MCSWWQGKGHGEARFTADGRVRFTWPTDPEDPNGEVMDPFAAFGMSIESLGWQLLMEGRVVQMIMDGYGGPQELVCRQSTAGSALKPCCTLEARAGRAGRCRRARRLRA